MVSYGIYYALGLAAAGVALTWLLSWPFAIPFYLLAIFCLNFFRDPERTVPPGPYAVSPADGKIMAVKEENGGHRISIFLNVFDVHVNRTPIPGKVSCVTYKKGQFLVASKEEASQWNEQTVITVDGVIDGHKTRVVYKQIAGLIARRIICYVKSGDVLEAGQRIGLMKFGSRMDVLLGAEWEVMVKAGERVSGGTSILAKLRDADEQGVA
jgi:phosphatidylserine decarboxylase